MDKTPGTYILLLHAAVSRPIRVGHRGSLQVRPGYYLYVGSAFGPGGVAARVARHCRADKPLRWHIDYLRAHAEPCAVWYSHAAERLEHSWATTLTGLPGMMPISGFGCTDCRCEAHLFFCPTLPESTPFAQATGHPVLTRQFNSRPDTTAQPPAP